MARVRVQNLTAFRLDVPGAVNTTIAPSGHVDVDVDDPDDVFNDDRVKEMVDNGQISVVSLEDERQIVLQVYADATRPSAASVAVGTAIFNTDDNFSNISDGTNWRDPTGAIT